MYLLLHNLHFGNQFVNFNRIGFVETKDKSGLFYPIEIHKTDSDASNLYHKINWGEVQFIRQIIVPKDALISNLRQDNYQNYSLITNKIILGETYKLYDIRTIKKFNIYIDEKFIAKVSSKGHVNILEWWLNNNSNSTLKYNENAINGASANGHIHVLEWWKNSGLPLKYNERAMNCASINGYVDVLEWWKNSGLFLKYDRIAFDGPITCRKKIQEWWVTSGLKVISYSSKKSYIEIDKNWEKIFA